MQLLYFSDFFKSYYYQNTYIDPVDLTDEALKQHLLCNGNEQDKLQAETAQNLLSVPAVQNVLSSTSTYELNELNARNAAVEKAEFTILGSKPFLKVGGGAEIIPSYTVSEHKDLKRWVIKAGGARIAKNQFVLMPQNIQSEMAQVQPEESLLRIAMRDRIVKTAHELGIEVILPRKVLVAYKNAEKIADPVKKYCVLSEKIEDMLSKEETIATIKKMDKMAQREFAKKLSQLVQTAGIVDASFDNIRLSKDSKKIVIFDTEPMGLLVAKNSGNKPCSLEKCARIGLCVLWLQSTKSVETGKPTDTMPAEGLEEFYNQLKEDYNAIAAPKLSEKRWQLAKYTLGLLFVVDAIRAFASMIIAYSCFSVYIGSQQQSIWAIKAYYRYIEGVPSAARINFS